MAVADQDVGLELLLRRAESLVRSAAMLAFSLEDFSINLPPISGEAVDQAQLRAIATLYLASELEAADMISAVETLTRLARTGSLPVDLGEATTLIQSFWQSRTERATTEERLGFFSGLFGTVEGPDYAEHPRNNEFEDRLIDLCEALYKLDEQASNTSWGGVAQQARVRGAAQRLIANLVRISSGITLFLAQEILSTIRAALEILSHPAVKTAFHARTPGEVIAAIKQRKKDTTLEYDLHIQRGQAGMTILAWLADAASILTTNNKPIVGLDHPVIASAWEWLKASLDLSEDAASAASTPTPVATNRADSNSPWTTLAE